MKVAVFGLGYVGTVTSAVLATNGHEVAGVDLDSKKVATIESGASPIVEPHLDRLVAQATTKETLRATTHPHEAVAQASATLICVGTPTSPEGQEDLSNLVRAVKEVAQNLPSRDRTSGAFHSVLIRSTVPPGTVEDVVIPVLEAELGRSHGDGFGAGMCPEFLREGSGVEDFLDPPFMVLGTTEPRVAECVDDLFGFLNRPFHVVPIKVAESLKYACNAFHAVKVSFTNEVSRVFRSLDVDSRAVMDLFCRDDRLNISPTYLRPGFAFGGSCLPKDLRSLLHVARINNVETPLLEGTMRSNGLVISNLVNRVVECGARAVGILGLSFKPQTDDMRESPHVALAETLLGKGLDLRIYDPIVQPSRLVGSNLWYVQSKLAHLGRLLRDTAEEALDGVDVAIVSSCSDEVKAALITKTPPVLFDLSGTLGEAVEHTAGYEGIGW